MNFQLQFLTKGKALCGKAFPSFVATWNWLVDAFSNMKGDADVDETQGHIKIDRSDPAHPVIRYVAPATNGGGEDEPEEQEESAVVTSLNSSTGALSVIGGEGISVSTDGQTITISYQEGKEADEDPNEEEPGDIHTPTPESGGVDPNEPGGGGVSSDCDHDDGGGGGGGVRPQYEDQPGSGISDAQGVQADAEGSGHSGNDNCNC